VPARHLAAGTPAKVIRELTEVELEWKANGTRTYQDLTERSLKSLRVAVPLAHDGPERRTFAAPTGSDHTHVTLHEYRGP
jgi:phenylacetic acid degradation protein